jgi:hypothetical protein
MGVICNKLLDLLSYKKYIWQYPSDVSDWGQLLYLSTLLTFSSLHEHYQHLNLYMRRIPKLSSVYKCCHCSTAVMMVHMFAEFIGPLGRQRCHLQTVAPLLCIVLCVYNVQENLEACCTWNAACSLFLEWHSSPTFWGVWRTCHEWFNGTEMVRRFTEGCKNMHDNPQSGRPSVVNEDLVHAVEEKIQENRRSTISSFSCIFHKFHGHFFTKLCLINIVSRDWVHAGCRRCL